jgi:Xaa-Pro aminopeptidase
MTIVTKRLAKLREIMDAYQLDFYLVPSTDPHFGEYVPECWQRRPWISGFTGSAGEVLITKDHAYLWTDGRYYLQVEQQLDSKEYTLMHQNSFTPETELWLSNNCIGKTFGVDPKLISIKRAKFLQMILENNGGKLELIDNNLIDQCRVSLGENLELPKSQAFILEDKYTGESLANKLTWLRNELKTHDTNYIVLSALDEIAWLFNLRGADIDYNPLIISYAIVGTNDTILFVDSAKINSQVKDYLSANGVRVVAYELFADYLQSLSGDFWLDDKTTSYWVYDKLNKNPTNYLEFAPSPIIYKRACKNAVESDGARSAHIKDSVALISFLSWVNKNWTSGIDELSCVKKLAEFRAEQVNLIGQSFNTISGFASNSAVIHYGVTPETNRVIDDSSLYLVDSGGQYLEGTTDVTRTIHLGQPTAEQKRHYTLVLKGHLGLGRTIFPQKTCGEHLDAIARMHLWSEYLNYNHGTGHGVGSCLCVHEGPHKISQVNTGIPLVSGMIVSNEPGFYWQGHYGIRIENLCLVVNAETKEETTSNKHSEYGPFYKFETLTLTPYCKSLIELDMLTNEEKLQIADYYSRIRHTIMPKLPQDVQEWLNEEMDI